MSQRSTRVLLVVGVIANVCILLFFNSRNPAPRSADCNPEVGDNVPPAAPQPASCPQPPPRETAKASRRDADTANKPYIFIGGVPSSGTTLLRVMLDAHPDIRCGEETRLVPRILQMRERWRRAGPEHERLKAAGLNDSVINTIVRNFISDVIELHGPPAQFLCNKDPLALAQMPDLAQMFPRGKFLLLVRDGRAVAHSIVSRNISISGVDHKSYLSAAMFWNKAIDKMWGHCNQQGPSKCLPVYFEKLVADPEGRMREILTFLGIPWHDNVIHHEKVLQSEVSLSK